ncbi:MAG: DNA replication and repair protein RecF [Thermoleophilia bacterium]|nr:DNA replication and repair protein RecF [Thermoleophilia bacterium]
MVVDEVLLTNVRCHRTTRVSLGEGLTILTGPNGSGKTSILEGLLYGLTGRSLRGAPLSELITTGEDFLRVEVSVARRPVASDTGNQPHGPKADPALSRSTELPPTSQALPGSSPQGVPGSSPQTIRVTVGAAYSRVGERRLTVDGAQVESPGRWPDLLPVVTFTPDDLRLVKGSPANRREYLDRLADRRFPSYGDTLRRYEEALNQRNALLRNPTVAVGDAAFAPWEQLLAALGLAVAQNRAALLADLAPLFQHHYALLSGEAPDAVRLIYRTNVAGLDPDTYATRLLESRAIDRQRTFTHLGPHRDDFRVLHHGLDARDFGSQGEQRTAVLALVLAEWSYWRRLGTSPLLLLDDVMSELDEERRRALLRVLRGMGQVVITAVDLRYFSPDELANARIVHTLKMEGTNGNTAPPTCAPTGGYPG